MSRHRHQWATKSDGDGHLVIVCEGCHKVRGRVQRGNDRRDMSLHKDLEEYMGRTRNRSREKARRARQIERGILKPSGDDQ